MDTLFKVITEEQPLNSAFYVAEYKDGPTHQYGHSFGRSMSEFIESTRTMLAQCDRYARVIDHIEFRQNQNGMWIHKQYTRAEVERFLKDPIEDDDEAYTELVTKFLDTLVLSIDDLKRIMAAKSHPQLPHVLALLEVAEDLVVRTIGGGYEDDSFELTAEGVRH